MRTSKQAFVWRSAASRRATGCQNEESYFLFIEYRENMKE